MELEQSAQVHEQHPQRRALARGGLGEGEVDAKAMLADAVKAFEGLADLFGADGGGRRITRASG